MMSANSVGMLTILLWSLLAVVLVFASSIPPFQIGAMTWFIAFIVMAVYLKAKGERRKKSAAFQTPSFC